MKLGSLLSSFTRLLEASGLPVRVLQEGQVKTLQVDRDIIQVVVGVDTVARKYEGVPLNIAGVNITLRLRGYRVRPRTENASDVYTCMDAFSELDAYLHSLVGTEVMGGWYIVDVSRFTWESSAAWGMCMGVWIVGLKGWESKE